MAPYVCKGYRFNFFSRIGPSGKLNGSGASDKKKGSEPLVFPPRLPRCTDPHAYQSCPHRNSRSQAAATVRLWLTHFSATFLFVFFTRLCWPPLFPCSEPSLLNQTGLHPCGARCGNSFTGILVFYPPSSPLNTSPIWSLPPPSSFRARSRPPPPPRPRQPPPPPQRRSPPPPPERHRWRQSQRPAPRG